VQTAAMARLFYLENKSKIEIAEEFGISRFKVARMLENAIRDGLIRLEIHLPAELDADLSDALRTRFDLTHAIVFTSPAQGPGGEGPDPVTHRLGAVAADLLTEIVTEGDVLGLVWGPGDRGDVPRTHRAAPLYSRAAERGSPAAAHRRQCRGGRAPDRFCRPRHRVPHLRPTAPA
jgi:Putative sugar-binding domain